MEEQNQEYRPEETRQEPVNPTTGKKQTGSVVGSIIVIIVIIVGGLYFWGTRITNDTPIDTPPQEENTPDLIGDALRNATSSDSEINISPEGN